MNAFSSSYIRYIVGAVAGLGLASSGWYVSSKLRRKETELPSLPSAQFSQEEAVAFNCNQPIKDLLPNYHYSWMNPYVSSESDQERTKAKLKRFVKECRSILKHKLVTKGIPGLTITVSVHGRTVLSEGLGLADVENNVPCTHKTVMRIASISKPLTAVGLLKLVEKGSIDLDVPIQMYLSDFPEKTFEGEPVAITTKQLLSNTSGIRHYSGVYSGKSGEVNNCKEYYIMDHYNDVTSSLELFINDELDCKPGSKFHYSTFGYILLSAIIERASGQDFLEYMKQNVFVPLSMSCTRPEYNKQIIRHRAKYYSRNDEGELENTAYVDNSYKWGAGGFVSTSTDLVKFGNALLESYNSYRFETNEHCNEFILDPNTVRRMWDPVVDIKPNEKGSGQSCIGYGLGWRVTTVKGKKDAQMVVSHSGGAVGASSILTIIPKGDSNRREEGVVVAIICNLQDVQLSTVAQEIAELACNTFSKGNDRLLLINKPLCS